MRKLVVLKLDGNLQLGVRVTLEIGFEGKRPATEITGNLPPNPDIAIAIDQWQSTYRNLWKFTRIKAKKIVYDGSISKRREDCHTLTNELRSRLNDWLQSESFRPVRERWLKYLMPEDEVRVIIRTPCLQLRKLPWHLWDLIDRDYRKSEVALSVPESEQVLPSQASSEQNKIKILAIFGDSVDIDVDQDRQLLKKLPNAAITFLEKPQPQDIHDQLWNQHWDILFFAGHSKSEGDIGRIYINQTDNLTINELKYALRNAVANGLQLAIFNSCDGLGLAKELQDLYIPQIIVMREPVPDLVAQTFLKYFLLAFSSGESIYAAVRTARERLEGMEKDYPGASWLPVICEHPAVAPMTWAKPQLSLNSRSWKALLFFSLLVTTSVLGMRHLGGLQTWEILSYDRLMRSRPDEGQDSRLLIVTITEEDFQLPEQQQRKGSLSDTALARLLEKLTQFQPRLIGLDIYRDFLVESNRASLATRLQSDNRFFAICKVSDRASKPPHPGISPPPEVPQSRLGFSDVIQDADGVVRRHLIAMKSTDPVSPCTVPYALSAQLAFHYLAKEGIFAKNNEGELQLGKVVLKRLRSPISGYQQEDTSGYQILLNYRSNRRSPLEIAPTVTLKEVLTGKINPEQVKDRIVLIGTTARSFRDYLPTPYNTHHEEMPGVILQAQMVSQILSAAKEGRPLISVLPIWGEVLWIWGWAVVGGGLALSCRSKFYLIVAIASTLSVLYLVCLVLFIQGIWLPLVPSALVLVVTSCTVVVYRTPQSQGQLLPFRHSIT
ncbi:CHASE2 domain-containing protein [Scytonema sp. NUACC26]|uniref:CHASE2 domain-containing protein n=1 Tax=Scytonema sp. NUACC26 TaxID=3140176 RepID=UPI0034DC9ACE